MHSQSCEWTAVHSHLKHSLFSLSKFSESVDEWQWVQFFLRRGIQQYTFASYVFSCQMPFCQTAISNKVEQNLWVIGRKLLLSYHQLLPLLASIIKSPSI